MTSDLQVEIFKSFAHISAHVSWYTIVAVVMSEGKQVLNKIKKNNGLRP